MGASVVGWDVGASVVGAEVGSSVVGVDVGSSVVGSEVGTSVVGAVVGNSVVGSELGVSVVGSELGASVVGVEVGVSVVGSVVGVSVGGVVGVPTGISVVGARVGFFDVCVGVSVVGATVGVVGVVVGSSVVGWPVFVGCMDGAFVGTVGVNVGDSVVGEYVWCRQQGSWPQLSRNETVTWQEGRAPHVGLTTQSVGVQPGVQVRTVGAADGCAVVGAVDGCSVVGAAVGVVGARVGRPVGAAEGGGAQQLRCKPGPIQRHTSRPALHSSRISTIQPEITVQLDGQFSRAALCHRQRSRNNKIAILQPTLSLPFQVMHAREKHMTSHCLQKSMGEIYSW